MHSEVAGRRVIFQAEEPEGAEAVVDANHDDVMVEDVVRAVSSVVGRPDAKSATVNPDYNRQQSVVVAARGQLRCVYVETEAVFLT